MESKFEKIYNFFENQVKHFANSGADLDQKHLEWIVELIETSYGANDKEVMKKADATLKAHKDKVDWKNYVLNLFEILFFSDKIPENTFRRVSFEA
mmetsp:Transcript_37788/g.33818  ORF Transcript_37788/g.33818 Transcript_37788/m.33818 type:complete len:96 (-) Transcript_37788:1893-2180(-)